MSSPLRCKAAAQPITATGKIRFASLAIATPLPQAQKLQVPCPHHWRSSHDCKSPNIDTATRSTRFGWATLCRDIWARRPRSCKA